MRALLPDQTVPPHTISEGKIHIYGDRHRRLLSSSAQAAYRLLKESRIYANISDVDGFTHNTDSLYYNTDYLQEYTVNSDKDQYIPVRIFPVSDQEYLAFPDINRERIPLFTFINPIYDIIYPKAYNYTRDIVPYAHEKDI